jgi:hypothetical protein
MTRRWRTEAIGLAAVTGLAMMAAFAVRTAPEAVLARDYGDALARLAAEWPTPAKANIWLSRSEPAPRPLRKALAVGDRVSIASSAGTLETFEVVSVEEVAADSIGAPQSLIQIVTGRPVSGAGAATVRFIFAVESEADVTGPVKADKTL